MSSNNRHISVQYIALTLPGSNACSIQTEQTLWCPTVASNYRMCANSTCVLQKLSILWRTAKMSVAVLQSFKNWCRHTRHNCSALYWQLGGPAKCDAQNVVNGQSWIFKERSISNWLCWMSLGGQCLYFFNMILQWCMYVSSEIVCVLTKQLNTIYAQL